MRPVAARLGCSEGQVWTLVLTAALAALVGWFGVVPATRGLDLAGVDQVALPQPQPPAPAPATTTPPAAASPLVAAPTPPPLVPGEFPAPSPAGPPAAPVPAPPAPSGPAPLPPTTAVAPTITETAWFTSSDDGDSIALGTLPVGALVGSPDKITLVRVAGAAGTLTLKESAEQQIRPDAASILLCPVDAAALWYSGGGQKFADLPKYDCQDAPPGVRAADGTWSFSLKAAPTSAGFALVPQVASPLDTFRVLFSDPTQAA